jgi:hypothetical protein
LVDVFSGYEESPFTLNPRHEDDEPHGKGIEQRGGLYQRRLKRAGMSRGFLKNA